MKKTKIIRITTVPISFEKLLENQAKYFKNYFNIIIVSSQKKKLNEIGNQQGVNVFFIPFTRKITPINDIIATYKLYRYLIKEKPTIVHTQTPKAGIVGMLASFLAKIPVRMHTVGGLPLMESKGLKRILLNYVEILTYALATNIYSNSFGLLKFIIDQKFCKKNKIKVLCNGSSNGIDLNFFDPLKIKAKERDQLMFSLGIKKNEFIFLYVGRLVRDKGINELVYAFKKILFNNKKFKLLLVGNFEEDLDPLKKEVIDEINLNPNIVYVGYQNDIRPYLAISNCFVFPTYREGFPNVILQAGAMNIPCIVSNINGCNEIIKDSINGILIAKKNIQELIEAMLRISSNHNLRNKLSKNSRQIILKNFDQKSIWESLRNEYNMLSNV